MNKKQISFGLLISAICIGYIVSSCKKTVTDTTKPTVSVEEPIANDTMSVTGDSVHVEFIAKDDIGLKQVAVAIKNMAGTILYSDTLNVDSLIYYYHNHYVPKGITALTPLVLTATASDKSANTSTQTVNFYIKP